MRSPYHLVVATVMLVLGTAAARAQVDFDRDILPVLSDRCFQCHGPDAAARKAGLRLDTFAGATAGDPKEAAIVPGRPEAGLIMGRLRAHDPDDRMPPPESGLGITEAEIANIEAWIRGGAKYSRHWAFVPPRRTEPPAVRDASWAADPIDRHVLARLERERLAPAPPADRRTLLRRAAFVLTGLRPDADVMDAFLADDSPDAWSRAVDRLLASPRYGEHMAASWMDLARYADTYGYQNDVDRDVWPWRDWVIRAFNGNMRHDEFLVKQVAGDMLPGATRDDRLATAFNRLHRQTNEGGSVEEEFRLEYVADRTQTFGTAFLGLTLECARCHDHKFDPISQREFYGLSAYFANIAESGLYSHFTRATPTPTLSLPTPRQEEQLAKLRADVTRLERNVPEPEMADLTRWKRRATVDEAVAHFTLDDVAGGKPANRLAPDQPARTHDRPAAIDGAPGMGKAVRLSGEDNVHFPGVGAYARWQPFSIALWMRTPDVKKRAVVFHRSRAWTDAASMGYEMLLEDGRLTAALIHFWPGDAIAIRTRDTVAPGTWTHVVFSYDGSSRADGLALWVNGRRAAADVVADDLTRKITGGGGLNLTLGQRFRDRGFKGGDIDEVLVFDRAITALEAKDLHAPGSLAASDDQAALLEVWRSRHAPRLREHRAQLLAARQRLGQLDDRVRNIMVMEELPRARPTYLLHRGVYDAPRDRILPHVPEALGAPSFAVSSRLDLARWLVHEKNPLTARVAVNRLWQTVFGRGLVATPENFGVQGARPSHPHLLDALALDLVESGWDVKAMLRRLLHTSTWRQSSRTDAATRTRDPENVLLARGPRFRLTAEMMRDHALHAAGLLVERVGGRSVKPYQPAGLWKEKSGRTYVADKGDGLYRRSLYTFWKRTSPPPSMMILDAAKRDVCLVRRHETHTPLQALLLLNDPQFVEAARVLAARSLDGASPEAAIRTAFLALTSRPATRREVGILLDLYRAARQDLAGDGAAAKKLLGVGAAAAPKAGVVDVAAMTLVCSTLINHDATIMLR